MPCEPVLFHTGTPVLGALARETRPERLPAAVVVDWERRDKERRQAQAAVSIGLVPSQTQDSPSALPLARRLVPHLPVVCRVDGPTNLEDVDLAIAGGAHEVLLPMVRHEDELDLVLEHAAGRIGVGIMVETVAAVERLDRLRERPLARAYVGLVDLALERRTSSIFHAFTDGVVDHVADCLRDAVPFGVGGLTLPGHGTPVPAELLAAEICRVGSSFSFMRRSFLAHLGDRAVGDGIAEVRGMLRALEQRSEPQAGADRRAFAALVEGVPA